MAPRSVTRRGRSSLPLSMSPATALVAALAVAATIGACGPGEGPQATGPGPRTPAAGTAPSATAPLSSTNPTAPSPAGSGTTATTPTPPSPHPPFVGPMKPIAPSAMEGKLREIGLDPAALPPLDKLDAKTLRDVMNTFTKALGVQCSHCHEKDFRAPTAKKKIATRMWNDFTRALALEGSGGPGGEGGAIYCDSCHGGRAQLLDRHDLVALGGWMQENYVDKLKRADRKDHGCETCHGDPFEGKILSTRWK